MIGLAPKKKMVNTPSTKPGIVPNTQFGPGGTSNIPEDGPRMTTTSAPTTPTSAPTTSRLGLANALTPAPQVNEVNIRARDARPRIALRSRPVTASNVEFNEPVRSTGAARASAGGDFKEFEDRAFSNATERYLNPQWDRARKDFDQSMIDRGIDIGTEAYSTAFDNFSRSKNDAYSKAAFDAMGYGRDTQNMKFNQSLANAQMANQANIANLNAGLARDSLMAQLAQGDANRSLQADLSNSSNQLQRDSLLAQLAQANANRSLQADQFNASNSLARDSLINQLNQANANRAFQADQFNRNYDLNELSTLSNIDMAYGDRDFRDASFNAQRDDIAYNRLASILSGLQQSGTPQVDVQGAYNARQQQANQNYQAQNSAAMANRQGLVDLAGSAALAFSDRRLKRDIEKTGEFGKLNVYQFRYKWDDTLYSGFMADEVEQIAPDAVIELPNGYKAVDYRKAMEAA